jgi:Terminase RNaseH-like domain
LIQELTSEGMYAIKSYEPTMDKVMRLHSVTSVIENGFVHIPDRAAWLGEFLHELTIFPNAKYDDQADSLSQALDWLKNNSMNQIYGLLDYGRRLEKMRQVRESETIPESRPCTNCGDVMRQRIPGGLRCVQCGAQWSPAQPRIQYPTRKDILNRMRFGRF